MEKIYENLDKLCSLNQQCKRKDCKLMHPRCLTGICIEHLQKKEHKHCQGLQQALQLKEVKKELKSSINGVYVINLCPKSEECPNKVQCQFLHRDWVDEQKLCIEYLKDECENKNCKRKHQSWENLKKLVQQKYLFHNLDPERLCFAKDCKCTLHHNSLIGFCLENFIGACSALGECPKIHVNWEEIKNIDKTQIENKKVSPCTIQNQCQIERIDTKYWEKQEILLNKNFLLKTKESIKERNVIDILFLMDCTGSMHNWINSAKNNILDIISSFQSAVPSILIRVAFIGYRDFCDKEKKIEYHDFTTDIQSIKTFISTLKADGGGDEAEDITGALEFALKLDFSKHPGSILCTYLICDAPTHGKQYHEITSDDLIDEIPKGQLEDIMKKINAKKSNNFFFCCKISESTQKMFKIMQSVFKNLEITEYQSEAKFPELVKFTLFSSYTRSQLQIQQPKISKKIRIKATYVKHIPFKGIKKDQKGNTINFLGYFLNQMGKNQISGETVLEIDLEPVKCEKNEEGANSFIFKVFDIRQNRNLIAKLTKSQFQSANQNKKAKLLIEEAERSVNIRYLQTMIAKFLASEFRNDTKSNLKAPPIFYPLPIKYELLGEFYQVKKLYAETEINIDQKWEKISNNSNFLAKNMQAYATFSHYTYEQTDGQLLITDLQGKGSILSDPAIHTNSHGLAEGLNDLTNSYLEGIEQFSGYQHKYCNELCKSLNLTRQRFNSDLTDNESVCEDKAPAEKKEKVKKIENIKLTKVNCICDLCGEIFVLSFKEYQEHNQYYFHCQKCSEVNERNDICKCCGNEFSYNQAQTLRQGYQPLNCQNCQECKEQKDKCEYCQTKCVLREVRQLNIDGVWKYLCKEGQQFFSSIYCLRCKQPFCYQQWPTLEEYSGQQYLCFSCKQK